VSAMYPQPILPNGRWVAVVDGFHLSAPVSVSVEVGQAARASRFEARLLPHRMATGQTWSHVFAFSAPDRTAAVALLGLHALDALTIWQKSDAETIRQMENTAPKVQHRSEDVWSDIVPVPSQ
jgi:hypothetical protein